MTPHLTVSVIVPTFNRARLLDQALQGLLAQTRVPDEVLVVDDGSEDDTARVVAGYGDGVRYLAKANGGKASALNAGLARVSSDYVWVFDDDDWPLPGALEQLMETIEVPARDTFVYSGCFTFSGPDIPSAFDETAYRPPAWAEEGGLFLRALRSFPFHQNGMLVPLACYRKVGAYNEALARGQDYDMILRLCREFAGVRLNRPTFALREHAGARGPQRGRHGVRDRSHMWLYYDRLIFRDIYETVSLAEYLTPGERQAADWKRGVPRAARIRRAMIMAHHGLLDLALSDLGTGFHEATAENDDKDVIRQLLTQMAFLGQRYRHDWESVCFLHRLGWTASCLPWSIGLKSTMRGVYWDFRQRLREKQHRDALATGVALLGALAVGCFGMVLRGMGLRSCGPKAVAES